MLEITAKPDIAQDMKDTPHSPIASFERACFRVVALILSRVLSREINAELDRLDAQPKSRSYLEVGVVLALLFALVLGAASLGVWALALLFVGMFVLFR